MSEEKELVTKKKKKKKTIEEDDKIDSFDFEWGFNLNEVYDQWIFF